MIVCSSVAKEPYNVLEVQILASTLQALPPMRLGTLYSVVMIFTPQEAIIGEVAAPCRG